MTLSGVDPVDAHFDRIVGRSKILRALLAADPAPRPPWSPTRPQRIRAAVRRQRGPVIRYWAADFTYLGHEPQRVEPWPMWARNAPRRLSAALRFGGVRQVTTDHYTGDVAVSGPTVYPDVCAPAPPHEV